MSSQAEEEEEEEEERQGEQARHRFYYSPCSLFEHAIKAFLKCLGLHDDHHDYHSGGSAVTDDQNHHHHPHPHPHPHRDPHTEREMKFTEEAVIVMAAARSATRVPTSIARARPKNHNKPPLSSGKGGQIN
ncbi:elicitor peptide 6-like isoform X2 [Pyrus x bretschneideri]|uniref:elicitor peptide 6-like isoform X2 n=1 Tax=Pyrus x bretschneideri TaxID=225117 RepID=UPI00202FD1BB|nr:elicitor peptide 6-like isoform X2 [Pyrus x bretschneideri]